MLKVANNDTADFAILDVDRNLQVTIGEKVLMETAQNSLRSSVPLDKIQPYVQNDSLSIDLQVSSFKGLG